METRLQHSSTPSANSVPSTAIGNIQTPSTAMKIISWRELRKGASLQGFFTLTLPSGLRIIDVAYHRREDARWIGMPARSFQKADGSTSWVPMVEFTEKAVRDRFTGLALAALDAYFREHPDENSPPSAKTQGVDIASRTLVSAILPSDG